MMTKLKKTYTLFTIGMKCTSLRRFFQGALFLALLSCSGAEREIIPPETPPFSRAEVGYAVVGVSYTKLLDEPDQRGVTLGYVREKTILKILERRLIRDGEQAAFWVLVEGDYQGWLPESAIRIYDTEERARTAAAE